MSNQKQSRITRRTLLQAGALGAAGLTLADWLRLSNANDVSERRADAVLFVNLAGGPAHLDTLDMKPEGPADTRGPFGNIQSSIPGLVVCEHLPKFAQIVDRFTLIRGISHTTGDHPQGQAYIATGNRPGPALKHPSYGSIVSKEMPGDPDLPPYVAIPRTEWNAGYMGDAYGPFQTNAVPKPGTTFSVRGLTLSEGVTVEKVQQRDALLQDLDRRFRDAETQSPLLEALDTFGRQAHSMVTSERTRAAFDVGSEPESIRNLFAGDELGQSLLLATRLIESGVKFVTVTNQGWDTHTDNFIGHQRLLGPLDNGLTAMMSALEEKGMLERTLVVVMGEFGRTPAINKNVGRDHYPRANWCLMAGAGVAPGQLIGGTNDDGTAPADGVEIHPDDLGATILHSLGIDPLKEYYTRTGRPVSLIPHGRIMSELFA